MNTISKALSLSATLILLLAGCSQQQVSGDGASQVAGSSQAQQVADDCPSCNAPKVKPVASGHVHPANRCTKSIRHNHPNGQRSHSHRYSCQGGRQPAKWGHHHPANRCTKSIRHSHPNGKRSHSHRYSCQGGRQPVRGNKWTHGHPANRCTKSIRHTHKFQSRNHSHKYSCQGGGQSINIHALQRKLKAKGYYKGPINGVINTGTRSALRRYQQRR